MIFVVGGGGKLKNTDAVLVVTVPTGSTVTATKGGTTLTPTMWVKAADNTLDCAIFSIPASQFDSTTPWTVTATLGTETASDTVLITTNKEYEVTLAYFYKIFDRSVDSFSDIQNGFVSPSVFTFTDFSSEFVQIHCGGDGNYRDSWSIPLPDDISAYSMLAVYCYDRTGDERDKIGITETAVTDRLDTWISSVTVTNTTQQLLQIELTSAMAGKYFTIRMNSGKDLYVQYAKLLP